MANRLWHGAFPMDHDTLRADMMVTNFPPPGDPPILPADYLQQQHHQQQRAMIAAYVKAAGRDAIGSRRPRIPRGAAVPWASGRTWYLASRFPGRDRSRGAGQIACSTAAALAGLVGDQALPFTRVPRNLESAGSRGHPRVDPRRFVLPDRVDRAYAICYSLAGAVINHKTPERWEAAMIALFGVAAGKNADILAAWPRAPCATRRTARPAS